MKAPTTFSKNGYCMKLLQQTGNIALYEARTMREGYVRAYEVHIVRQNPQRVLNGVTILASPRLASNEDFGKWGWSYTSYELALECFERLSGVKQ